MQLISTKQYHEPSTEYYKRPLSIDQLEYATKMWRSQRMPVFVPLSDNLIRQYGEEAIELKYRILDHNPKFDGGLCPEEERENLIQDLIDLLKKRECLILVLDFSGISFVVPSIVSVIYHLWRRVCLGEFGANKYIVLSGLSSETKLTIEDRLNAFKDSMLIYENGQYKLIGIVDGAEGEYSVFLRPVKDIELLESFYTFNNPIEVKRFLLTHDYLIKPLFETYKHVKQIFGENIVDVCLECDQDPEEDFEGLSAIIKTNLSPELSLNLLDKFDGEWWLDIDDEIRMVLTIMVRPV